MARYDDYKNIPSRTELNRELYTSSEENEYNRFDVNSNQEILKENARKIDVNQIRDMLDQKYRDDMPKRRTITIEEPNIQSVPEEDTKEYDLKALIDKAKNEKPYDYDKDRLKRSYSSKDLIDEVRNKYADPIEEEETAEEKELKELIKTITDLEIKNSEKDAELLGLEATNKIDTENISKELEEEPSEEEFYTGKLKVNDKDFDDFSDIEKDIKSNSVLIKILITIFIIVVLGIGVYVANNMLDLGWF